jgi:PAS domain S-box-containing protein
MEESLRQSEERFRLLVDSVRDYAIFLVSPDGRVMTWNEGAQRMKGYAPEEIIGQPFTRFYTPEDLDRGLPQALLTRAEADGRVENEGWRVRRDGSRFWANAVITALRDSDGHLRGFAKITRDLTERRQAEDARTRASREEGARVAAEAHEAELRASRDQLAAILSGVTEGVMAQDRDGRIVYANDIAAQMCGFPDAEELLAASISEVINRFEMFDEDGLPLPRALLPAQRALRGESVTETTIRFRTVGNAQEDRWSIVHATAVRDAQGEVRQVISIFRDITQSKWAEDTAQFLASVNLELTRSLDYERTLRRIAELAVPSLADWCAVHIQDDDGRLRRLALAHVDPAKVHLAEELSERYPDDPAAGSGLPYAARSGRALLVRDVTEVELEAGAHDAEHLAILRLLQIRSVIIVPLLARGQSLGTILLVAAESGRHYGHRELALAEDLATRAALAVDNARLYRDAQMQADTQVELNAALRNAMTQLEESMQTRDEFLAAAAHDLKNPLASIKGLAQLLLRRSERSEGLSPEKLTEGLERIDSIVSRASEQVEELLDVARLQMARPLELELKQTDLVELARQAIAEQKDRSERHQLSFESSVPQLIGMWDSRRLLRALGNLLDNAIKYSPEGGPVRVSVSRDESKPAKAVLTVEDRGVGIPQADLPRIFDRFMRGTNVVGEIAGTGIGLPSARHIIESHGGTITVASREGYGTSFTIRLPLLPAI